MQVDVCLCQIVSAGRPETVLVLAEMVDSLVAIHHLMNQAMVDIAEEMVAHCPFELVVEANQGVGPQIEGSPYLESLSIAIKASDYHIQGICSKDHMHSLEEAWVVLVVQGVDLSVEGSEVLVEVPAVHLICTIIIGKTIFRRNVVLVIGVVSPHAGMPLTSKVRTKWKHIFVKRRNDSLKNIVVGLSNELKAFCPICITNKGQ
jgi:hypothetical protein